MQRLLLRNLRFNNLLKNNPTFLRYASNLPKYHELRLPALSPTMEQGNLLEWNFKEGDEFADADSIAEVETDKATVAWEMQGDEGFIAKLFLPEGSKNVKVGTLVGIFVENEADIAAFKDISLADLEGGAASAGAPAAAAAAAPAAAAPAPVAATNYPKHNLMSLPALSPTMQTGTILNWTKNVGDEVNDGDMLAEIETDKASVAFEVYEEGYIAKILVEAGTKDISVGTPILVLVDNEEDVDKFKDFQAAAPGSAAPVANEPVAEPVQASTPEPVAAATPTAAPIQSSQTAGVSVNAGERLKISPLAKKILNEANPDMDLFVANVEATGPNGRIREADVQTFIQKLKSGEFQPVASPGDGTSSAAATAGAGPTVQVAAPDSGNLAVSAPRTDQAWTLESKQTIPHYYLTSDINLTKADELIATLNKLSKDAQVDRQDVFLKAAALASKKIPDANSEWLGEENIIRQLLTVNIELKNNNHIYNVNSQGLGEINQKANAEGHRDGGVPSLSVYSFMDSQISAAASIIKPGQACSLTISGVQKEFVIDAETNKPKIVDTTSVTLSCDHRLIDGAVGAEWLKWFKLYVEEPTMMLM